MFSKCVISFLLVFSTLLYASKTSACSIAYSPQSYEKVVADSDVVFAGIVKSTNPDDMDNFLFGTFTSEIDIFKSYKGWPSDGQVELKGLSDDCWNNHRMFKQGRMLIIFANYDGKGNLSIPNDYSMSSQQKLLNYLEKGEGKDSSAECLEKVLENLKQRPAPAISLNSIQDRVNPGIGHGCLKKYEIPDNPFRFIPPSQ